MSLLIGLALVAALVAGGVFGAKRGLLLVGLEILSFSIATLVALGLYQPIGQGLVNWLRIDASLGNVAGFVIVWSLSEVGAAALIRFKVLPHLHHHLKPTKLRMLTGGVLNVVKVAAILTLALILIKLSPLPQDIKRTITKAPVASSLLAATTGISRTAFGPLGRDFAASLNVFTVTSEPESDKRVDLGFTASGTPAPALEDQMLGLINKERTAAGLRPLTLNVEARAVARAYSVDMLAHGYFSHQGLDGSSPFDRMRKGNVSFKNAGENLALAPTLQLAHDGLMKSPGHRANILSPKFKAVGIGIIDAGPNGLMVTQDFTD